jgi:hypothetical protein
VAQSRWSEGQPVSEARSLADEMMFGLDIRCAVLRASLCGIDCFGLVTIVTEYFL